MKRKTTNATRRNFIKYQLSGMRVNLGRMVNSNLLTPEENSLIYRAFGNIVECLNHWKRREGNG